MTLHRGVPYEYSRSASGLAFLAGACPLDAEGNVVAPGDLEVQTAQAVANLLEALAEVGAGVDDVVKTTVYVVASERSELVRAWDAISARLPQP